MRKTLITNNIKKAEFEKFILEAVKKFDFTHATTFNINIDKFAEDAAKNAPDIAIHMTLLAYVKMSKLVATSDKEIAWHGHVTKEGNVMTINDIYVYPQVVTSATVDAHEEQYGGWMISTFKEELNHIRMQGHSHVNMGVSPSSTDTTYYKDLLSQIDDFYIFLIINKKGEVHTRVYDKINNVLYTEIPLNIIQDGVILDLNGWTKSSLEMIRPNQYIAVPPAPRQTPNQVTAFVKDERTAYWEEDYEGFGAYGARYK